MYKRILYTYILIVCCHSLYAQHTDSIAIDNSPSSRQAILFKNANLIASDTNSYGLVSLNQMMDHGNLRRAKQAYSSSQTNFFTEGYNKIGRFTLFGQLTFNKVWEDSLAYSLEGIHDDLTSYHYFAGKPGKFERQNYIFKTGAIYQIIPEKLAFATTMDYHYHWSTRSVDPRPAVRMFNLTLVPEIIFQHQQHRIGLQAFWGKGDENTSIEYKNDNFNKSTMYPERNYYTNHGYGFIALKSDGPDYRIRERNGIGASYIGTFNSTEFISRLNYLKEEEYSARRLYLYDIKELADMTFFSKHIEGDVLITKRSNDVESQIYMNVSYEDAYNNNQKLNGSSNYEADRSRLYGRYSLKWNKRTWSPEINAAIDLLRGRKEDFAASHLFQYQQITPSLSNTWYKNSSSSRYKMGMEVAYTMPNTSLDVPNFQINSFTRGVAYPDFYYFSSSILGIRPTFQYINRKWIQKMDIGFFAKLDYQTQLSKSDIEYNATFIPDKYRLGVNLGVQLYL